MAARAPPAAPGRHHVLSLRLFSISRTFLIALAILVSRCSGNAGSAPLLRNFSSALLGLCCDLPTFDEIRLLEDLDPLHPWLANLRRFPHHAGASRQLRFHKNISVNAMPSGGPPPRPSATSPPTSPSTRFASIEPTTAQPQAQFQLSAGSALLGYLIVEVSQMEVLWPLAVSVGSPEVVSVMRPADFNSGIPFLTVFALPTLIFN